MKPSHSCLENLSYFDKEKQIELVVWRKWSHIPKSSLLQAEQTHVLSVLFRLEGPE
jgi:hypothetical protein